VEAALVAFESAEAVEYAEDAAWAHVEGALVVAQVG
jgi:hypothetical protein